MSTTAALLNPAVFATTIIPLAMAYVAAFLCGVYVPRALGYSRSRTIIIIDVLGDHAIVPLDRYSKWEDIHRLLLERFADKNGAEYVRSRAYTIMDTGGESAIIKPEAWAQTVKEGMILEMSIVVRQPSRSLRCPWCAVAAQMPDEEFLHCKGCKRHYRSSQDDISTEAGERVVYGHDTVLEPTTHANSAGPEAFSNDVDRMHGVVESNALNAEDTQSRRIGDMKLFRRIIVELLREQLSGPGSGHMAGAHQRRVKADWEGATQELSAKASEGVIGRGDAAAVDFLCDMMRQFASFEGHGAQLVDGMSIEAILAVMSGPGDGKGSSGVSDEGALGPDDKYDFDQQLLLDFEAWERGENDGDTVGAIISEHERKRG
ncbi:hypothetical protein PENSPDRAFT_657601 [Peniophora sp. CONT]|nr:hypothetical protein PENSPDRAFT_657601 [Peniophora sp. CONT]